jgi:hypothetical protein
MTENVCQGKPSQKFEQLPVKFVQRSTIKQYQPIMSSSDKLCGWLHQIGTFAQTKMKKQDGVIINDKMKIDAFFLNLVFDGEYPKVICSDLTSSHES